MNTKVQNDFSVGSVSGNILRLAVPLTLAQLVNILYNIVDRIYIGHIPGASTDALTGVGLSLPVATILMAFALLFGSGGAPLFSMARGAGDLERAKKIMSNCFSLITGCGILIMVLGFIVKRPMLYLFGASEISFPYAHAYLSIYLCGTVFVMISLGMNYFINAQGFGVTGMLTVSIGAILNLILDPIFIFILHMGVRGAALATVISQFVSAAWVFRFLNSKKAIIRLSYDDLIPDLKLTKEIVTLGLSGFVMAGTNSAVQIACNYSLSQWGGDLYVGIMTILNSVREITAMPVHGLTNGCQPVLSFNYGAKRYDRVKEGIRFITIAGVIVSTLCWGLIFFFPHHLIRIFSNDPNIITAGVPAMHLYFFGFFMMALQFAGQSTFTSLGKAKQAIFFSLFRKIVIVVPLTLLLPRVAGLGTTGVFLAEPISNAVGGIACYTTMILTVWRKLET